MLEPKKVIDEPTSNGTSQVFTAQWYPDVVALLIPAVESAKTVTATLMGSLVNDKDKGVELDTDTYDHDDDAIPQKLVKSNGEYWLYYWLEITTSDSEATIEEAWIGAGGV